MSHLCSDLSRHMRLFELIRQQNLAADRAQVSAPSADQMNRFVTDALRSLHR